jgi:hypothetical protein
MTPLQAVDHFIDTGWTKEQACAIVANLIWESGGKRIGPVSAWTIVTTALGDRGKAHGAGQWQASRYHGLLSYTMARWPLHSSSELLVQLGYIDWEMGSTEKKAARMLRATTTLEEATEAVCKYYLRPSIPHLEKRIAIAKALYDN